MIDFPGLETARWDRSRNDCRLSLRERTRFRGAKADNATVMIEQGKAENPRIHGNVWCNVACWNLCLWLHTMVELWSWRRSGNTLRQRSDRPWDDPSRRPSHADRLKTLRKQAFRETFSALPRPLRAARKIQKLWNALTRLAT
jgi:hypothetical protein